jgi:Lipocalin-like domain
MNAIIVMDNRAKSSGTVPTNDEEIKLFGTIIAYAGTYTTDRDKIVDHVDISWNQSCTGTEQVRFYKLDGDTLTLTTAVNKSPRHGLESRAVLVFKKVQWQRHAGRRHEIAPSHFDC